MAEVARNHDESPLIVTDTSYHPWLDATGSATRVALPCPGTWYVRAGSFE